MSMAEQQWSSHHQSPWSMASEHAISKPIMVAGSGVSSHNDVMSPRSTGESSGLCVRMVENVLGSSPTSANSKFEQRKKDSKVSNESNATIPNGIDPSSHDKSPSKTDNSNSDGSQHGGYQQPDGGTVMPYNMQMNSGQDFNQMYQQQGFQNRPATLPTNQTNGATPQE